MLEKPRPPHGEAARTSTRACGDGPCWDRTSDLGTKRPSVPSSPSDPTRSLSYNPGRPGTGSGSSGRRRSLLAGNLGGKTCASSWWAFEAEAPAERLDPIGEADESRAGAGLGASNAIVADDDGGDAV